MQKASLPALCLLLGSLLYPNVSTAQHAVAGTEVPRKPLALRSPVQDKNFYLLSLIESSKGVASSLTNDPELASLARRKLSAESDCGATPVVCVDSALFSSEEIALVEARLIEILRTKPEVGSSIIVAMRQSGLFQLYASEENGMFLSKAWSDAAHGLNSILRVYGEGQVPRYAAIDSSSFDIQSIPGRQALSVFSTQMTTISSGAPSAKDQLWFQPSLRLALLLLALNKRDEAGRFEPLEKGENALAVSRLSHIKWTKFPYSAIVVPGLGPEEAGVALDPGGVRRLTLAAKNYQKGLAPYILVTGGNVHPSQTPYCEAIEMKKSLIRDLGVPADAIVVEPQARHTTTNLRNASRLLYRYGFPLDMPILVTTDEAQTSSIVGVDFAKRNQKELGYLPFHNLKPISPTDTAFSFAIDSLQANSLDPLDP
jgi:hypothetical protein